MADLSRKKELILEYETIFINRMSKELFAKPQLNVWMILIPIIFIFFFQQFSRYRKGKTDFQKNTLITPKRALGEACDAVEDNKKPDLDELMDISDLPAAAHVPYRNLLKILVQHYMNLLSSKGKTYQEMIRNTYPDEKAYDKHVNELAGAWKALNLKAMKDLTAKNSEVKKTVARMNQLWIDFRMEDKKEFYLPGK